MSRTYKATGINLKGMPLGESDRLLTILTREYGLVRVVAPGVRKLKSRLGGRSSLFVVNELLIAKGRSLDKISQAETLESYPGLGKDLTKLTASQYLAELVLYQALSDQPQEELFLLLCEHLTRLEQASSATVLSCLTQAIFHFLAWAGIAPQLQICCTTQRPLTPDYTDPDWRIGFSLTAGGVVSLSALETTNRPIAASVKSGLLVTEVSHLKYCSDALDQKYPRPEIRLTAAELDLLQRLAQPDLLPPGQSLTKRESSEDLGASGLAYPLPVWLSVERTLRQYAQYHFDRPIRSAALMDTCFSPLPTASFV
jgi:DNA repair protein RecO (recombination protein O)